MEDVVSSFPLLNLPNGPLKRVLRNMKLFHQIGFSVISKRSKELIRSLNLEVHKISFNIGSTVNMGVSSWFSHHYWYFHNEELIGNRNLPLKEMYTPDCVRTWGFEDGLMKRYDWKKEGYEIKDWIDHFLSIFNHPKLDRLSFEGSTPFDINSLQRVTSDVSEIQIDDKYPVKYIQQILQTYPSARQLDLSFTSPPKSEDYHNILCQGFDALIFNSLNLHNLVRWKLDDLLIMSSRSIRIDNSNLPQRDVNKFLKHWSNGSNPRMVHLDIRFRENINLNKECILRGLNYQIVSPFQERLFKKPVDGSSTVIVKGGYDIQRNDGTTARIVFHENRQNEIIAIEVFVWH